MCSDALNKTTFARMPSTRIESQHLQQCLQQKMRQAQRCPQQEIRQGGEDCSDSFDKNEAPFAARPSTRKKYKIPATRNASNIGAMSSAEMRQKYVQRCRQEMRLHLMGPPTLVHPGILFLFFRIVLITIGNHSSDRSWAPGIIVCPFHLKYIRWDQKVFL